LWWDPIEDEGGPRGAGEIRPGAQYKASGKKVLLEEQTDRQNSYSDRRPYRQSAG